MLLQSVLDISSRNKYDLEITVNPRDMTLARVKVMTPLPQITLLDTGYSFSGQLTDFNVRFDNE